MTFEPRKVFVGGIPRTGVKSDDLKAHFTQYGEVVDAVVVTNPETGLGRGFGFVEFADEAALLKALEWREREKHVFNDRRADVKRAQARHGQTHPTNPIAVSKKIFVGGLRDNVTKDDLSDFFEKFGVINDVVVMYDRVTRKPRGFGFVTFDSLEAVDKVLQNRFHDLDGTKVETKMAEPREHSRYQHGYYHDSMNEYRNSANSYAGMCSPHNVPYLFYNGSYMIPAFPYLYAPQGSFNYGYMMNQTTTSNDTGMMTAQSSPMYPNYGSSYYLGYPGLNGGQQGHDISAHTGVKSDPVITDSNNLL